MVLFELCKASIVQAEEKGGATLGWREGGGGRGCGGGPAGGRCVLRGAGGGVRFVGEMFGYVCCCCCCWTMGGEKTGLAGLAGAREHGVSGGGMGPGGRTESCALEGTMGLTECVESTEEVGGA